MQVGRHIAMTPAYRQYRLARFSHDIQTIHMLVEPVKGPSGSASDKGGASGKSGGGKGGKGGGGGGGGDDDLWLSRAACARLTAEHAALLRMGGESVQQRYYESPREVVLPELLKMMPPTAVRMIL
jgi:hypothetical protein